jgi:hypothetical protein
MRLQIICTYNNIIIIIYILYLYLNFKFKSILNHIVFSYIVIIDTRVI